MQAVMRECGKARPTPPLTAAACYTELWAELCTQASEPQPLHWFYKAESSDSLAHLPPSTLSPKFRGADGSYIKKSARLHGPHKDLEGVLSPCRDNFSTRVNSHTGELRGAWRREGAEIPVPENK